MARGVRKAVYPFLRPKAERIYAEPWCRFEGALLGDALADWDYQTKIHIVRDVVVDTPAVLRDCELGSDAVLQLSVVAESQASGEKTCCFSQTIHPSGHTDEIAVEVHLGDKTLGGGLGLTTLLTLRSAGSRASRLAPQDVGSVLWEEHTQVLLEGSGARFPVETLDFLDSGWLAPDAAWYLDWSPDFLEQPFLGTVRLFLNSRHSVVMKAVTTHEPDDADRAILSAIYYETGRSLILGALGNDAFVEKAESYDEGTVGRLIDDLLSLYFPGETRKAVQQRAHGDTEEFNVTLRHALKLFGVPQSGG